MNYNSARKRHQRYQIGYRNQKTHSDKPLVHNWQFNHSYGMTRIILYCSLQGVPNIEFCALNPTLADLNNILFAWIFYYRKYPKEPMIDIYISQTTFSSNGASSDTDGLIFMHEYGTGCTLFDSGSSSSVE